jgi:hypothetical protein
VASEKTTALVLPKGVTASTESQAFGGIPGIYPPGEPVFLSDTGISEERAKEIGKDASIPLKLVQAVASPEELPVAGRHFDADALEPGDAVPHLAPAAPVASAFEGHNPDGSPLAPPAESEAPAPKAEEDSEK